jgi:hypothetical protein
MRCLKLAGQNIAKMFMIPATIIITSVLSEVWNRLGFLTSGRNQSGNGYTDFSQQVALISST